ncbi:MAG: DUF992 domain-containing protein [Rhizobiaceae bacterium]
MRCWTGANVLVGGSQNAFALQPLSVSAGSGGQRGCRTRPDQSAPVGQPKTAMLGVPQGAHFLAVALCTKPLLPRIAVAMGEADR